MLDRILDRFFEIALLSMILWVGIHSAVIGAWFSLAWCAACFIRVVVDIVRDSK